MFKEVVRTLETGALGEIGLFAFLLAFILITIRILLMPKKERDEAKNLPLDEPPEIDSTTI